MRNRLLVSVALCAVAVAGAGAPTFFMASQDVSDSQELVNLATLNQETIGLSHALADERDSMVEYIGAGRTSRGGAGLSEAQRSRVDRQIADVRKDSTTPPAVKKLLSTLPKARQQAIGGRGTAMETFERYSAIIDELHGVSGSIARGLPARAQSATADALPDLDRAAEQASAVRGLLSGALAGRGFQRELTSEAQQAHAREQAALADFDSNAATRARETLGKTVTGTDVATAERYVGRLTDRPYLQTSDRLLNRERFQTGVSARIDRMRGVQASLAADEVKRLEKLRDDDVTDLELLIALLGVCLVVAVAAGVQTARSMARPLSVLRRGSQRLAQDPVGEAPVEYNGRNDEFADVVRALNSLRETAAALHEQAAEAEADNTYLVNTKDQLVAERDGARSEARSLQDRVVALQQQAEELREQAESMSGAAHGTFVNLAMRTLGLVERQLGVIEGLEEKETDPDRLGTLFKLDHLATRMRRHSENLLLLAGSEHGNSHHSGPVPLLDVLRAAVSEIERYERVDIGSLPPHLQVAGHAADDVSHLTAELLDNATFFSPPDSEVQLSGWLLESGDVMLSVQDEGIGLTAERLAAFNERLANPSAEPPASLTGEEGDGRLGMGLYVVAQLAARQNLNVQLRAQQQGGVAAVVTIPRNLLPSRPAPVGSADVPMPGVGRRQMLPGSEAEANSNALPARRLPRQAGESGPTARPEPEPAAAHEECTLSNPDDPMVAAAEEAVRKAEAEQGSPVSNGGRHAAPATESAARLPEDYSRPYGDSSQEPAPEQTQQPTAPAVTEMGLPKRQPQHVEAGRDTVRPPKGGANAEELRRRLGGFQRGALSGRRDVAAEASAGGPVHDQSGAQVNGGTAEEARN